MVLLGMTTILDYGAAGNGLLIAPNTLADWFMDPLQRMVPAVPLVFGDPNEINSSLWNNGEFTLPAGFSEVTIQGIFRGLGAVRVALVDSNNQVQDACTGPTQTSFQVNGNLTLVRTSFANVDRRSTRTLQLRAASSGNSVTMHRAQIVVRR